MKFLRPLTPFGRTFVGVGKSERANDHHAKQRNKTSTHRSDLSVCRRSNA
jgi:hypothetical protein